MRMRAPVAAVALAAVMALLVGCTSAPTETSGTVTVAVSRPFTSVNPATSYGNTVTNLDVAALTRTGFGYYDDHHSLVRDESFGTARILSTRPFTVRYTVAAGITWSDGRSLDARDLLLSWAARSGAVNTTGFDPSRYIDSSTGRFTSSFPTDVVWFDGTDAGLSTATSTPVLGNGDRSLDVTYGTPFSEWATALEPTLPAHVVGSALGASAGSSAAARTRAVTAAIQKRTTGLRALSRFWNDAGNVDAMPTDRALLTSSGPYRITSIDRGSVTLTADPAYRGDRAPTYRRIRLKLIADPLAQVAALTSGAVDIATPSATEEVTNALVDVPGVKVTQGAQGVFEHLDFQIRNSHSGTFANADVRRAFLHVVPREEIVQQLVQTVDPEAEPLRSFTLPPGSDDYAAAVKTNGSTAYRDVDVAAATTLLHQAGVSSPQVCILYDPSSPRRRSEFQLIQQSAARAGFRVTDCSSSDWRSRLGVPGAYDAALDAWDASELGTASIGRIYRSDQPLTNVTGYSNADVDGLVDRLSTASISRQKRILAEIDAHLWSDAYGAPLFQYPAVSAVNRTVSHVSLSPLREGVFWNAWRWAPSGIRK